MAKKRSPRKSRVKERSATKARQAAPEGEETNLDDAWASLCERYPTHPALTTEAVYSLPPELISLISKRAPAILSSDDEEFEHSLVSAASIGFFRQKPIEYPLLNIRQFNQPPASEKGVEVDFAETLWSTAAEEVRKQPERKALLEAYLEQQRSEKALVDEWCKGYAGWLATSDAFRHDRDELHNALDGAPSLRSLPRLTDSLAEASSEQDLEERLLIWPGFFSKWGIESMATWDLPMPMRPSFATATSYPLDQLAQSGLLVFIPWYLLRHRGLNLYSMADRTQVVNMPSQLAEWMNAKSTLGVSRYFRILQLYVYLDLALKRRYGPRLSQHIGRLDAVFAEYFASKDSSKKTVDWGVETMRKARLDLSRRLKALYKGELPTESNSVQEFMAKALLELLGPDRSE